MMREIDTATVRVEQNGDHEARERAWLVADSILRPHHLPAPAPRHPAAVRDHEVNAPSLRQWLAVPVRVLVLAVLVVPTTTVAAFAVSSFQRPTYGATVDLLVNTREFDSEAETLRVLATQRVIVHSDPVMRTIAEATGEPLKQLRESVSTEVVDDSEVLRITVAHPSPEMAYRLVEAVTSRYMAVAGLGEVPAAPAPTGPSGMPADLDLRVDLNQAALTRSSGPGRRDASGRSVPVAQPLTPDAPSEPPTGAPGGTRRGSELSGLRAQVEPPEIRILSPARLLEDPLTPKPLQSAVAGFLVGCLLAGGLVFVKRTIQLGASGG